MSETSTAGQPNGKPLPDPRRKVDPVNLARIREAWAEHDRRKTLERERAAGKKATPEKNLPTQ